MENLPIASKSVQNGRIRISTTVKIEDWRYAKREGLKWSDCIGAHIRNHRAAKNPDDPDTDEGIWQLRKSRERLIDHRRKILEAIKNQLGEKGFNEFLDKL